MDRPHADATSASLLVRLRDEPANPAAWEEFVHRYRPRIHAFCLARRLQPADADEVTQVVLVKLVARMRGFSNDPSRSFRAWLKAVTRNTLTDYLAECRQKVGSGDSAVLRLLESVEAREGLVQQVEAGLDRELLDEAIRRVRPHVPPQQWEAFRLTALEGATGQETAARLGMLVATVYTSKSKVQKLIRQEVQRLEEAGQAETAVGQAPGAPFLR